MLEIKQSVRPALPTDAEAIGMIQATTLPAAVRSGTDAHIRDDAFAFTATDLIAAWQSTLMHLPSAKHCVLVALSGQQVEGFAAMAPSDPYVLDGDQVDGYDPETGFPRVAFEITNFEVDPRFRSAGHEARLMAALTDIAREGGATELHIWAIAGNDAVTSVLSQTGFVPRPLRRSAEISGTQITEHLWWVTLAEVPRPPVSA
ncbi:N-acetyltransferase family protein [Arcanobacterium canis]